jgi:hypothetical protein
MTWDQIEVKWAEMVGRVQPKGPTPTPAPAPLPQRDRPLGTLA